LLKDWLRSVRLTHISLALVGLMWVFPFLHYVHRYPLTTFYQEWWSALLGIAALTLLVGRAYWQRPEIPRIVQLPVGLAAVALLQLALGKMAYFDQALLYTLYLLFAALLMMLGAWLRDCFGFARLAQVLAICLLIGAELSCRNRRVAAFSLAYAFRFSDCRQGLCRRVRQTLHNATISRTTSRSAWSRLGCCTSWG